MNHHFLVHMVLVPPIPILFLPLYHWTKFPDMYMMYSFISWHCTIPLSLYVFLLNKNKLMYSCYLRLWKNAKNTKLCLSCGVADLLMIKGMIQKSLALGLHGRSWVRIPSGVAHFFCHFWLLFTEVSGKTTSICFRRDGIIFKRAFLSVWNDVVIRHGLNWEELWIRSGFDR